MPIWRRPSPDPGGDDVRLVVGLGNPGREYERTRHNIGFMVVEHLAAVHGLHFSGSRQHADVARGSIGGVPVLLATPKTYMNDSGHAVSRLMRYYRITPDRLLVVCDDMDIPFGTLRLRPSGSSGGQRGLQSVIREIGGSEFARLRVGIGRPRHDAIAHVLQRFLPEQERVLPSLISVASECIVSWLERGTTETMNRFNRDWTSELSA